MGFSVQRFIMMTQRPQMGVQGRMPVLSRPKKSCCCSWKTLLLTAVLIILLIILNFLVFFAFVYDPETMGPQGEFKVIQRRNVHKIEKRVEGEKRQNVQRHVIAKCPGWVTVGFMIPLMVLGFSGAGGGMKSLT